MPTFGATFRRVEGRTYRTRGPLAVRELQLGEWADALPDVAHVLVEAPLIPRGSYHVTVTDDGGHTVDEGDCKCFSTDCTVNSLGCALTCFIFPLNLTCPRCLFCFLT